MKTVTTASITASVRDLCIDAAHNLKDDVAQALVKAREKEISATGKDILDQVIKNMEIARTQQFPLCQDTGVAVVFVEMGQDVSVTGGYLIDAINEGVRRGYADGYLRKSMVKDPLKRVNTGDNTPAIIHTEIVPGSDLKITLMAKGGGCENMSGIKILTPADGVDGVKKFVVQRVQEAGSNPCPPIVVGVGIGGNFEKVTMLSKKALLRPVGKRNPDPDIAALEDELLDSVNALGIGPQGLGGTVTALAVQVEVFPCHITSLPVAVNIECHSHRHAEVIL